MELGSAGMGGWGGVGWEGSRGFPSKQRSYKK